MSNLNLAKKLEGIDYTDADLRYILTDSGAKEWKDTLKKVYPIVKGMSKDMYETCVDKISNAFDKFLSEGEPRIKEACSKIKEDMEKDNGPTWICIIGKGFAFNVKSQKETFLYCYIGHFGVLLYKC